jgi:hypothetical protein
MLSEALTSLEDVKSRLQQNLLQQPEYRALLVIDQAMSQLTAFLGPFDPAVATRPESRADVVAASSPAIVAAPESSNRPARDALDIVQARDGVANATAQPVVPAREPPPAVSTAARSERATPPAPSTPAIFRMAAVLRELAGVTLEAADAADRDAPAPAMEAPGEPREADLTSRRSMNYSPDTELPDPAVADERTGPGQMPGSEAAAVRPPAVSQDSDGGAAEPPVSSMGALYRAIGDGLDDAPSEDRGAQGLATGAWDEFAVRESTPAEPVPVSGMAATLYETTGDAPDVALAEDGVADAPAEPAFAADPPTRAPSGMERMIAKAAQAVAPVPSAPAPRSFLPYIAAQRLVQSRRL